MNDRVQVPISYCCSMASLIALYVPALYTLQAQRKRRPMSERAFSSTEQEMKKSRGRKWQQQTQEQDACGARQKAKPTSPTLFSTALCIGPSSSPETRCANDGWRHSVGRSLSIENDAQNGQLQVKGCSRTLL